MTPKCVSLINRTPDPDSWSAGTSRRVIGWQLLGLYPPSFSRGTDAPLRKLRRRKVELVDPTVPTVGIFMLRCVISDVKAPGDDWRGLSFPGSWMDIYSYHSPTVPTGGPKLNRRAHLLLGSGLEDSCS